MNKEERIKKAVREFEDAGWQAVVDIFPESTSGDLDPATVMKLIVCIENAIREWVEWNVKDDLNLEIKQMIKKELNSLLKESKRK